MTVEDDDAGVALPEHGAVGAGSSRCTRNEGSGRDQVQ